MRRPPQHLEDYQRTGLSYLEEVGDDTALLLTDKDGEEELLREAGVEEGIDD